MTRQVRDLHLEQDQKTAVPQNMLQSVLALRFGPADPAIQALQPPSGSQVFQAADHTLRQFGEIAQMVAKGNAMPQVVILLD